MLRRGLGGKGCLEGDGGKGILRRRLWGKGMLRRRLGGERDAAGGTVGEKRVEWEEAVAISDAGYCDKRDISLFVLFWFWFCLLFVCLFVCLFV